MHLRYYDATHPEARRFIWEQVREDYYRHGVKVWWLDACEPEIYPLDHDNLRYHLGNGLEVAGLYPLLHQQAFYDGMRAAGEDEIMTLCRSAWAGSQRYGAAVWSGDIPSTFEALRRQVRAGLNIGLSGIPWWTTDIGGFHGGDIERPVLPRADRALVPVRRLLPALPAARVRQPTAAGMPAAPNEVWSFGEEAYAIIARFAVPARAAAAVHHGADAAAAETGTPPMRPLFFDFPGRPGLLDVEDQFISGRTSWLRRCWQQGATRAARSICRPGRSGRTPGPGRRGRRRHRDRRWP